MLGRDSAIRLPGEAPVGSVPVSGSGETGSHLLPVYAQFPLRPVSGRGSWIVDEAGERWLDAYGGHAVASTGHSHPHVVAAIAAQAERLLFYSTVLPHENRERLAEELARRSPAPLAQVFFCNSGAEANENALYLARRHTGRQAVLSLEGGWHGRTPGCLAVTDGPRYEAGARRAGLPLSHKLPFNQVEGLERAITTAVAAVILEPVQGMSGARACTPEFLGRIRELCTERGVVLIYDEVQCGVGRCGAFTAAEALGVVPDVVTLAKGLASGLPIGAVITAPSVTTGIGTGDLGSTFGGGPVPCAAALATLEVLDREQLIANAREVGDYLSSEAGRLPGVQGVQGRGLLLGFRLDRPAAAVQRALFARRILTGTAGDPAVLRLIPPLCFTRAQADLLLSALREVLA